MEKLKISSIKSLAPQAECITLDGDEGDSNSGTSNDENNSVKPTKQIFKKVEPENLKEMGKREVMLTKRKHANSKNFKTGISHLKRVKLLPVVPTNDLLSQFVEKCQAIDQSTDMFFILDNKINKLYKKYQEQYDASTSFRSILKDLLSKLEKNPQDVYVFVSHLREELKAAQYEPPPKRQKAEDKEIEFATERDHKNALRLSQTLKKLERKIKKLEKEEVGWDTDDENDSSYLQLQRFKERAFKVYQKLCSITKESRHASKIRKIRFSGTPFKQVNLCIEKFVNSTGEFPDYKDIHDIVCQANLDNKLNLPSNKCSKIASKAFMIVGKELQSLRRYADAESVFTLIEETSGDPAEMDTELKEKLEQNKEHWKKESEVIDAFVALQEDINKDEEEEEEDEEEEEEEDVEEGHQSVGNGEELSGSLSSDSEDTSDDDEMQNNEIDEQERDGLQPETANGSIVTMNNLNEDFSKDEPVTKMNGVKPVTSTTKEAENSTDEPSTITVLADCESQETVVCESVVSSTEEKIAEPISAVIDSSDDIVILDLSGDEEDTRPMKCTEIKQIKSEVPDEDLRGKIKVKSLASLGL